MMIRKEYRFLLEPDGVGKQFSENDQIAFLNSLTPGQKKTFDKASPERKQKLMEDYFSRGKNQQYNKVLDEDEANEWLSQLESGDRDIWNTLDDDTKARIMMESDEPGLSYPRRQMLRLTTNDRANVTQQLNEADKKAYETQGQGVDLNGYEVPLPAKPLTGNEMTPEQKVVSDNAGTTNTVTINNNGPDDKASGKGTVSGRTFSGSGVNSYSPKSIMDAYYAGEISPETRNYYIADALSKFARNTGKDIGNIGAQFSGGTINNNYEDSAWTKRTDKLGDPEWQAQQQARELDNVTRTLNNFSHEERVRLASQLDEFINSSKSKTERIMMMDLKGKLLSGQALSDRDLAVTAGSEAFNWIKSAMGF